MANWMVWAWWFSFQVQVARFWDQVDKKEMVLDILYGTLFIQGERREMTRQIWFNGIFHSSGFHIWFLLLLIWFLGNHDVDFHSMMVYFWVEGIFESVYFPFYVIFMPLIRQHLFAFLFIIRLHWAGEDKMMLIHRAANFISISASL